MEFVSILIITPMHDMHMQKLDSKQTETATVPATRPTLRILTTAAIMTAVATALALLGLHIQILCLQFVYVILNNLRISTHFELAGKIWHRICVLQNGFDRNLDDSYQNKLKTQLLSRK
ncbi:MAG: hypothetical protein WCF23_16650 [Candidatus Nitrosopolaris sp.]